MMTNITGPAPTAVTTMTRTGCSDAPQGTEQLHALAILVADRPGSVDRVVGVLRRRRAQLQSFNLSQTETPDIVRVTALVKDTKVGIGHLFEQVRKIVDVREASHIPAGQAVMREIALVKVNCISAAGNFVPTVLEIAHSYRARVLESTSEYVNMELMGAEETITGFIETMSNFGICEVARSGSVALVR